MLFLFFLHIHTHLPDHVCGFEDQRICGFSQDRSDVFDWTRQNHLSQNPKRSANTGPETDRSGTKEGEETRERLYLQFQFYVFSSKYYSDRAVYNTQCTIVQHCNYITLFCFIRSSDNRVLSCTFQGTTCTLKHHGRALRGTRLVCFLHFLM